jgi:hypothetical protein
MITSSSGLVLRATSPAWSSVRLDDILVPRSFHDGALRPIIVPGILDAATMYPGNYPTEYGGSIGGLLTLWTKRDLTTTPTGYVDANLADVSAVVRVPLAKQVTLSAGGQYSYLDHTFTSLVPRRDDVTIAWLPAYWDGALHLVWKPNAKLQVTAVALASHDRQIDVYANPDNPTLVEPQPGTVLADTQIYRGIVTAEARPTDQVQAKMVAGGGMDIFGQANPGFHVHVDRAEGRPSVRYSPIKSLTLTLGGELVEEKATGTVAAAAMPVNAGATTIPVTTTVLAQRVARSGVGYVAANWSPWKRLELEPGIRLGTYSQTDETYTEPRGLVRLKLVERARYAESLALKVAAGIYRQRPSLFETDAQLGNPTLTSMLARQYLAGIEYRPVTTTHLELDGFYAEQRHVVVRTSATLTRDDGTTAPAVFSNEGSGSTSGFEVFAEQELWKGLDGWLFYTYATSSLSQPTVSTNQSAYDQTHMLGASLGLALPMAFHVRGRFIYATGLPTTGIAGTIFNASTAQYVTLTGASLGERVPAYEQLDLRVDKVFALGETALTVYLDVRNVTNRVNVGSVSAYNYDSSRAYYRTGMPLLPLLGARVDF